MLLLLRKKRHVFTSTQDHLTEKTDTRMYASPTKKERSEGEVVRREKCDVEKENRAP